MPGLCQWWKFFPVAHSRNAISYYALVGVSIPPRQSFSSRASYPAPPQRGAPAHGSSMRFQPTPLAALLVFAAPAIVSASTPSSDLIDLGCSEFNRYEELTPNDTLSLIVNVHNPEHAQGFLVVSAVDESFTHIGFDALIGQTLVIDGIERFEYSVNAFDYRAKVARGDGTDLNSDGNRDLDGNEYERTGAEILVPRFIAVPQGGSQSELILVGLSGGVAFDTTVDFLLYNDNEEVFSAEHTFNCWEKLRLTEVSNAFRSDFLYSTDHDDNESLGGREYGWFRMQGAIANSMSHQIADPSIAAVYIERVGPYSVADLPFEIGLADGSLLPRTPMGGFVPAAPAAVDPEGRIQRRQPGSLLLFPEFDSRGGHVTLITVTNTDPVESVHTHFVYYGKYGVI